MCLSWANFWEYFLPTYTLYFRSQASLIPCSSLPETRELYFFIRKAETHISTAVPSQVAGNYGVFMDLEAFVTQPSFPHRKWSSESCKQWELTGLWTSWEDRTPVPQAATSGIHRGNGAWQSPHCPTTCGGKMLILQEILSQRSTAMPPPPP